MNFEPIGFAEYYSPSGVLLEKEVPRVLPLPLHEEKAITPRFPNPQYHTRQGMRGNWRRSCSECGQALATTNDPFPGRTQTIVRREKRFYKTTSDKPFSKKNIKILKSKRKPIFCPECKPTPKQRPKEDEEYFAYSDSLDARKKANKARAYEIKNKERIKAVKKAHYQNNKEQKRAYRITNKEKIKATNKDYYEKNKEKSKATSKDYRITNKEQIKANAKDYYEKNKETIKAKQKLLKAEQTEAIC